MLKIPMVMLRREEYMRSIRSWSEPLRKREPATEWFYRSTYELTLVNPQMTSKDILEMRQHSDDVAAGIDQVKTSRIWWIML